MQLYMEQAVGALPGEKVELTYGEKLRIDVALEYMGPAQEVTLYGAIGIYHPAPEYIPPTFDEKVAAEAPLKLPDCPDFRSFSASVEIPIISDIRPGTDYDIYCKIKEYPDAGMPQVNDAIDIVGRPPTYTEVYSYTYPRAKKYRGKAEWCIAEYRVDLPEQVFPKNWAIDKINSTFEDEIKKQGAEMLQVKIFEDATPLLWTYYRVEAIATKPKAPAGMIAAIQIPWAIVIVLILGIIFLALALALVINVKEIDWGKPAAAIGMALGIAAVLGMAAVLIASAKKKQKT